MQWQLQNTSDFGTSTPAVARTVIQGSDILKALNIEPEVRDSAIHILVELQQKLLRCVAVYVEVDAAVKKAMHDIESGVIKVEKTDRLLRPPSIPDLQGKVESFLQGAKLAIAQAIRLTEPFYKKSFGHQLNNLEKWAIQVFGAEHFFAAYANGWQPFVKKILDMRDAVDHPKPETGQILSVKNFIFESRIDGLMLMEPKWSLGNEPMRSMRDEMSYFIEGIIRLHEEMLHILFKEHIGSPSFVLYEIPEEKRDVQCPIRMKIGLGPDQTLFDS